MEYTIKIRNLRERQNLTQEQISNQLNISRKTYSNYENEDLIIPIKHLDKICEIFNVSIDYILGLTTKIYYDKSSSINTEISGIRIKELRKNLKLSQVKLATILNISQANVVKYEKGINIIATPFLYTICTKYKVSADYLLGKIDYNPKLNI